MEHAPREVPPPPPPVRDHGAPARAGMKSVEEYLSSWDLDLDGDPIERTYSLLWPVRYDGRRAMLKLARNAEERAGGELMEWWGGSGAAAVYGRDGEALLMERAVGERSLIEMAERGEDDEATRIICEAATELQSPREAPLPRLIPLERWFEALWPLARREGGLYRSAAGVARRLIGERREVVVLHGDIHHGNILDFGDRGWLAIDPKGLRGERTFDFVNLLRNPNPRVALAGGRFDRQVELISRHAHLDRRRLLEWTLAFTCLSAAWLLEEGEEPQLDLAVARLAAARLGVPEGVA